MSLVLVVGGGLSGAVVAKELADLNTPVTIIEASPAIGGKVRSYGCKATDKCNNCGVCLTKGLWESVEKDPNISIMLNSKLVDLTGEKGSYTATVKGKAGINYITGISDVVVATGFKQTKDYNGFLEINGNKNIMLGSQLEAVIKNRSESAIFEKAPESISFIQCYGSRDCKENGVYCSRVCCAYSTRAAKLIKQYYPDCKITFFYMELQTVNNGDYFNSLKDLGIEFIKCRPIKLAAGDKTVVTYDNPESGNREQKEFDLTILSDGIHPNSDAARIAEICGLSQDEAGFLTSCVNPDKNGIYVAGCAKGPAKIEETYNGSVAIAKEILFS